MGKRLLPRGLKLDYFLQSRGGFSKGKFFFQKNLACTKRLPIMIGVPSIGFSLPKIFLQKCLQKKRKL
jgi:hypothetical protein